MKIVVFGLPGSGRSTLARELGRALNAVVLDEGKLFETLNSDLKCSAQDYAESARRIGWVASVLLNSGVNCVCDMLLPTLQSRICFRMATGEVFAIWMDTIDSSKDANANAMWEILKPKHCNLHISNWCWEIDPIVSAVSQSLMKWGEIASLKSDFVAESHVTSGSLDHPDTVRDTDSPETVIGRRQISNRRTRSHDRRSIARSVWSLLNTRL
jgi:adenylate kinase family enzyme